VISIVLGMIGFMIALGSFAIGRMTATQPKQQTPEARIETEIPEEEKQRREQFARAANVLVDYYSKRGRRKE